MVNWTEVIISICTILITGVIIPLATTKWKNAKAEMDKTTQDTVDYWVEVGVRWAKQWMQSETGEKKKEQVLAYVTDKLRELKIDVSAEDLDKIIEAIYGNVKHELERKQNIMWDRLQIYLSGIILIGGALAAVLKWIKPVTKLRNDVGTNTNDIDKLKEHEKEDLKTLEKIQEMNRAQCSAMLCMINHMIDGNGVSEMKKTREEIQQLLVNKQDKRTKGR